jgi:hypothetical protein
VTADDVEAFRCVHTSQRKLLHAPPCEMLWVAVQPVMPLACGALFPPEHTRCKNAAKHTCRCRETATMRVEKFRGCMFVNQYLVVKFLGRGACGKVFLCLNTQDLRLYAMKVCGLQDSELCSPEASLTQAGWPECL